VNKLALAIPALLAAAWLLLELSSLLTSLIFAIYLAGIATSIASNRNSLAYAVATATTSFSALAILSKLFAVDLVYAVIASTAVLIRGSVDEGARAFNLVITAAIAVALMPYTHAILFGIYRV